MHKKPGNLIAKGRTAEVFEWEDGKILKLYKEGFPNEWVDHELAITKLVQQTHPLLAPAAESKIVEIDERRGIVYEQIDGHSMLEVLENRPWRVIALARTFADLQAQMHTIAAPDLPAQRATYAWDIEHAEALSTDLKARALAILDTLPDGGQLLHGDFHPGNIILTENGPMIIDWMTARCGHPLADVRRSALIMELAYKFVSPRFRRGLARILLWLFRIFYLRRYFAITPQQPADLDAWTIPIAAARIREGIAYETDALMALITSH